MSNGYNERVAARNAARRKYVRQQQRRFYWNAFKERMLTLILLLAAGITVGAIGTTLMILAISVWGDMP